MAFVTLDIDKLRWNFDYLENLFTKHDIQWAVVTKILCGNKEYLNELLAFPIRQVCDSRVTNLKRIKEINPNVETIYIKPPAKRSIRSIIRYADVSVNTELATIKLLSDEAEKQHKIHKIIIMVELGELREGVMREDLIEFYAHIFKMTHIEVVGIGANLSCLYGVLPNHDKLIQLSLYEQLIEAKFNRQIQYVSGGSSVTIPLIFLNQLPQGINHFRVGESLFLGTEAYNNAPIEGLETNVFTLYSEIIEMIEKPQVPMGEMGTNVEGHTTEFNPENIGKTSYRAIVDMGLLDIDVNHLTPVDPEIEIAGGSSDMLVLDLKENRRDYKVSDLLEFKMDYMGILRILNSKYIDKRIKRSVSK